MSLAIKVSRASYQGDPGLWGFIKGAAKTAVSFVTAGPTAAVGTALGQMRGTQPVPPPVPGATTQGGGGMPAWATRVGVAALARQRSTAGMPAPMPVQQAPGFRGAAERFFPGGATGLQVAPPPPMVMNGRGGTGGFHLNKSDYFLRSGEFVAAGTKWVRNRRRNPGNIRAASRALSRVTATKKALQTFSKVSIRDPKAVKSKTVYKCNKCGHARCRC